MDGSVVNYKPAMRFPGAISIPGLVALASAETLVLRDGTVLEGKYFGGDSQNIRFIVDGELKTFSLSDVAQLNIVPPQIPDARQEDTRVSEVSPQASEGFPQNKTSNRRQRLLPHGNRIRRQDGRCGLLGQRQSWATLPSDDR